MAILIGAGALVRVLPGWPETVVIGASAALGTLVASMCFLRWERWPAASAGLVPDHGTPLRFLLGLGVGLGLVGAHTALMLVFGHVRWAWSPAPPSWPAILLTVLGFLLLACREELAFRGYPLHCGSWRRPGGRGWRRA
jgi:hypothetical protein